YKKYENWRTLTNQSEWFKAVQTPEDQAYRPELGVADDGTVIYGDPYYGWYRSKQTVQTSYYPTGKYLALFTSIPDETGANYTEPTEETTYQRINLDTGYFTRLNVMDDTAVIDTDNGGATIANKDVIYYPEVVDVDWGTIVGFGIFEDKDVATGEPYLWGKLNESVLATVDHVPLFRKQGFKLSLK
ncbi:hypothetical protein J6A31_08830, partial [bacterium]|nr:hypothetical protein [bacterium]